MKRRAIIKRAAAYAKEYAQAENTLIQRKRQAKKNGNAYVDSEPKLAFVIRIRGINQVSFTHYNIALHFMTKGPASS